MKTTLNKIRAHGPCAEGWEKLLKHLGKTKADDEPLSILAILDSNGLDDAIWCMKAIEGRDKEIRLYAVWCARRVQHLIEDPRSLAALDVAERFANGEATVEELNAARDAAPGAALGAALGEAWGAAWCATRSAARSAAEDAVNDAAWDAVNDEAEDAAWDEAWAAQADYLRVVCAEIDTRV